MNARVLATVAVATVVGAAVLALSLLGAGDHATGRPAPRASAKPAPRPAAPARPLPAPAGETVLRITGVAAGNVSAHTTKLDLQTLDAIANERVTVREPFLKHDVTFTGIRMGELLRRAGGTGSATTLHMHALDDYTVDLAIPALTQDALLATRADGRRIPIAKGGPIRLIFTAHGAVADNTDNWIWSIDSMRARG